MSVSRLIKADYSEHLIKTLYGHLANNNPDLFQQTWDRAIQQDPNFRFQFTDPSAVNGLVGQILNLLLDRDSDPQWHQVLVDTDWIDEED